MNENVKLHLELSARIATVCRMCNVRTAVGDRVWTLSAVCLAGPTHKVPSFEAYCQDCYQRLHDERGLGKLGFPAPSFPLGNIACVHCEVLVPEDRLSPQVPRLKALWIEKEDLDGFRKFNQALKEGFGFEEDCS